ncbi:transporter substrate-binding domain-containing protein [Sodalis sp. C49]|uniref:transporter substrate-binding domain-containing protein n=1 Tax=Sodalis sp. C49 TaxID=3228929 RepID=UPI003965B430
MSASVWAQDNNILRFGTALGYAPFEYRGSDGQMTGFEIELGNAICAKLQKKCQWVETEISTMIPALKSRKFDAILASIGVTEARKKQLLFTNKVHVGHSRLIARDDAGFSSDTASLAGKSVGVEQGTNVESFAKKVWAPAGVKVISYSNQDLAYSDLRSGRLDAVLTGEVQGELGFLSTDKGKGYRFAGNAIENPLLGTGESAIAVDKNNQQLADNINQALKELHADGTYQKIARKYFPPSIDIYGQ